MTMTTFADKCRKVANDLGVDLVHCEPSHRGRKTDCYEDDGNLHIHYHGTWACFDVADRTDCPRRHTGRWALPFLAS